MKDSPHYINSTPDSPKGLREAVKTMGDQLIKITNAHIELDLHLANLDMAQVAMDDPEMMGSVVESALKKFFTDAGYHSTVDYLDRLNTNY